MSPITRQGRSCLAAFSLALATTQLLLLTTTTTTTLALNVSGMYDDMHTKAPSINNDGLSIKNIIKKAVHNKQLTLDRDLSVDNLVRLVEHPNNFDTHADAANPDSENDHSFTAGDKPEIPANIIGLANNNSTLKNYTPIVMWHGMGDCANCSLEANTVLLKRRFPGVKVFSVQIGSDSVADRYNSYIGNANEQIADVCKLLLNNDAIHHARAVNMIGFSQGSQLLRGLIQRCPFSDNQIRVKNLISMGGQHQGVFGLPNCPANKSAFCRYFPMMFVVAYEKHFQENSVQAQYWHDPMRESIYKAKSVFLADINNERKPMNELYKQNLIKLDNFVMVMFENDDVVVPRETSHFGYFMPGSTTVLVPMERSELYTEDRIGLKVLDETRRLHKIAIPGKHVQYNMTWFVERIANVYLDN